MKATTDNIDPIQVRMLKGRRIARMFTISTVAVVGLTAMVYPDIFRSELQAPTAEEREKAKQERKKNSIKKKKVERLTKEDVRKLAKLRSAKTKAKLQAILRKIEQRIIIAETAERKITEVFREDPRLMQALNQLIPELHRKATSSLAIYQNALDRKSPEYGARSKQARAINSKLWEISRHYRSGSLEKVKSSAEALIKTIEGLSDDSNIPTTVSRKLKGIIQNIKAIQTNDKDLAVRGYAEPEDHPLNRSERSQFDDTIAPMSIAQLHELSQLMSEHYSNLAADVEAAKLAEAEKITLPEAIEKMSHDPFDKDDLQEGLNQETPSDTDELAELTDALNEAERSAERALREADG